MNGGRYKQAARSERVDKVEGEMFCQERGEFTLAKERGQEGWPIDQAGQNR